MQGRRTGGGGREKKNEQRGGRLEIACADDACGLGCYFERLRRACARRRRASSPRLAWRART
eukprot:5343668-Pleurochrysis_carterae.AAC.2